MQKWQSGRHLSNIAVKVTEDGEAFYPLFDNGRSLFYEDREDLVVKATADPLLYVTALGPAGTYYDALTNIAGDPGVELVELVDLDISADEIRSILEATGFEGYRFDSAAAWIGKTLAILKAF